MTTASAATASHVPALPPESPAVADRLAGDDVGGVDPGAVDGAEDVLWAGASDPNGFCATVGTVAVSAL